MPRSDKILLAYDGSPFADAALEDLARGGLPASAQALIVTFADIRMPPVAFLPGEADAWYMEGLALVEQQSQGALRRASALADGAAARVRKLFPKWKVTSRAALDDPAEGILRTAAKWKPTLIVIGSHGHSALDHFLLGGVSHRTLAHAACNVRIVRDRKRRTARRGACVLLAIDGSRHAEAAVATILRRSWKAGTVIRVVVIAGTPAVIVPDVTGGIPFKTGWKELALRIAEKAAATLASKGLRTEAVVREGDPREEIVREAARFKADCLFVGSHGHGALRRFLMGSTSMSVAEHAGCTVEIVR